MKSYQQILVSVLVLMTFQCAEPTVESTCIAHLKGKVVSQGPACAGVAIRILSGSFDPARVDTLWFDAYVDNAPVYRNVFKTYPYCSGEHESGELLLDAMEKGTEFYFIFAPNDTTADCGFGDCIVCKPLVSLPESTNRILMVDEECNDQVVIY